MTRGALVITRGALVITRGPLVITRGAPVVIVWLLPPRERDSRIFFLPLERANFDDLRPLKAKFDAFEHLWGSKTRFCGFFSSFPHIFLYRLLWLSIKKILNKGRDLGSGQVKEHNFLMDHLGVHKYAVLLSKTTDILRYPVSIIIP